MGKPDAPPAPDYAAAAQAQGVANKETAIANNAMNRVDQYGPDGSSTWSIRQGADPNNPQVGDYRQVTSLSPVNQALYDADKRISLGLYDTAQSGLNRVSNMMSTPFSTQGMQGWAGSLAPTTYAGGPSFGGGPTIPSYGGYQPQAPTPAPAPNYTNGPSWGGQTYVTSSAPSGTPFNAASTYRPPAPPPAPAPAAAGGVASWGPQQVTTYNGGDDSSLGSYYMGPPQAAMAQPAAQSGSFGPGASAQDTNYRQAGTSAYGSSLAPYQGGPVTPDRPSEMALQLQREQDARDAQARQQIMAMAAGGNTYWQNALQQQYQAGAPLGGGGGGGGYGTGMANPAIAQSSGASFGGGAPVQRPGAANGMYDDASRQRVEQGMLNRLQTQFNQDEGALRQQLLNSGLEVGTDAWNREMDRLTRQRDEQRFQALASGGAEESRQAQLNLGQQNQAFNQALQSGQFNNQMRGQQIQEALAMRQLPLNEINALRTGNQVGTPQFGSYYTANAQAAPIFDAATAQGNYNMQAAQMQQSGMNGLWGGLATLGGAGIMKYSDRRLKTNLKLLGKAANGFDLWSWDWKDGSGTSQGHIAQDVQRVRPDAVLTTARGYLAIDYSRLEA